MESLIGSFTSFIEDTWEVPGVFALVNNRSTNALIEQSGNIGASVWKIVSSLISNRHSCKALQKDWNNHGPSSFTLSLLVQEKSYVPRVNALLTERKRCASHYDILKKQARKPVEIEETEDFLIVENFIRKERRKSPQTSWREIARQANEGYGYNFSPGWYCLLMKGGIRKVPPIRAE